MAKLSHHESQILALVRKWQPTTAYFVRKALAQGLASTFSDSPGSVYPAIERLKAGGYLVAEPDDGDGRRTERLRCTQVGDAAVRDWLVRLEPDELLPEDPWRTRIAFLDALEPDAVVAWLFRLQDALRDEAQRIEAARADAGDLSTSLGLAHASLANTARIAWTNEAVAAVTRKSGASQ